MTRSLHLLTSSTFARVQPGAEETGDPVLMLSVSGLVIVALFVLGRVITSRL